MREIKFRAWIEPKGADFRAMANVSSIDFETRKIVVTFNNPYFAQTKFEFGDGDYTLMQSTELKDKNGREIYEGDILEIKHLMGCETGELIFKYGAFLFDDGGYSYLGDHLANSEYIKVIGNIYENPELLEVSL